MVEGSNSVDADERGDFLSELVQFLPGSSNYALLNKNVGEIELAFLHNNENWLSPCPTYSEAAAICKTLDSVISIGTSIAYLSAALGIPITILLSFRPDWRWGPNGNKTNWHPDCVLIRQSQSDDWEPVFVALQQSLAPHTSIYG